MRMHTIINLHYKSVMIPRDNFDLANYVFLATVTTVCAKRTGATANVEHRRREPVQQSRRRDSRAAAPALFAHAYTLL